MKKEIMLKSNGCFRKITYYLGVFCYFFAFIGIVGAPAFSYWSLLKLSRSLFAFALCLTIISMVFLLCSKHVFSENINFQMFLCYLVASIIFVSLFVRSAVTDFDAIYMRFACLEGGCLLLGLIFWAAQLHNKWICIRLIKKFFVDNKVLILLCSIIFFLSLEQITKNLRWDSIHYYAYIERIKKFTFSPNDIGLFKASRHFSYGYILIYSIGEAICPETGYGVRIETIVLFIISICFLFELLKIILPDGKKIWRLFSVAIYAVSPVILGPIHNIDVEVLALVLLILVFYLYAKKFYIIGMMCSLSFVFTKESCVLILAAFFLADTLLLFVKYFKNRKSHIVWNKSASIRIASMYIPLVLFGLHFCMGTVWGSSKLESSEAFNSWGINCVVVVNKIKQLFVMNFSWVICLTIVLGIIFYVVRKVKQFHIYYQYMKVELFFTYCAFLFIQMGYITYTFPRYIMMQYFFLAVMFQWAMNQIIVKFAFKTIFCTLTLSATLIQNFYSLDVISQLIFEELDIGTVTLTVNAPIAYLDNLTILTGDDSNFLYLSPYADINRQWSYFDTLINKFLQEIDYNDKILIVYPDDFYPRSYNVFLGMWSNTYYNQTTQRLNQIIDTTLETDKENLQYYNAVIATSTSDIEEDYLHNYESIYFLTFSFSSISEEELDENYEISNIIEISYRGWALKAYKIK